MLPVNQFGAVAVQPPKPGFGRGLASLFSGFGFLVGKPAAWPVAMVPFVVLVTMWVLLGWASVAWLPDLIAGWIQPESTAGTVGTVTLQIVVTLLAVVVAGLLSFSLAQPLSGPALEHLVRLQERDLGLPERPSTNFIVDIGRSLQSLLIGYAFGLPPLLLLFVVDVLFPPAVIVTVPLKMLVTSYVIAWDLCDYPLTVKGLNVGERVRIVARNWSSVLGFSFALGLAALVPCLLFIFLPAGVVGATRLMAEVERYERSTGRWTSPLVRG